MLNIEISKSQFLSAFSTACALHMQKCAESFKDVAYTHTFSSAMYEVLCLVNRHSDILDAKLYEDIYKLYKESLSHTRTNTSIAEIEAYGIAHDCIRYNRLHTDIQGIYGV